MVLWRHRPHDGFPRRANSSRARGHGSSRSCIEWGKFGAPRLMKLSTIASWRYDGRAWRTLQSPKLRPCANGGPTRLLYQPEVGFHPRQQQQHQNTKLRDSIDHALLLRIGREDNALRLWPDRAEYRGPKQNSGDHLPHDVRLPDPLHRLTQEASDPEILNRDRRRRGWPPGVVVLHPSRRPHQAEPALR